MTSLARSLKFLAPLCLLAATLSQGYTPKERLRVLDYYLQLQEKDPHFKDDRETQTVIDALVHTYTIPNTHSVLEVARYEDAIASFLNKRVRDPNNEAHAIVLEALRTGIQHLSKNSQASGSCTSPGQPGAPLGESAGNCMVDAMHAASSASQAQELAQKAAQRERLEALEKEMEQKWPQVKFDDHALKPALAEGKKREKFRGLMVKGGALSERPKHFIGYWNKADGDCALHGLHQKRAEFVRRVGERLETDLDLRNDLRFGTYQLCGRQLGDENEKCLAVLDSDSDAKNLGLFRTYLNTTLSKSSEYLDFAGGSTPVGTLVAAARVFRLNVRVWRPVAGHSGPNARDLQSSLEVSFGMPDDPYVDLIHEGLHFNLLLEKEDIAGRISALERERSYIK